MLDSAVAILAFVYAVSAGDGQVQIGATINSGENIPESARGVLIPNTAVLQFARDTEATLGQQASHLSLRTGEVRIVAAARFHVRAGDIEVVLDPQAGAVVHRDGSVFEVCTESGGVHLSGSTESRAGSRDTSLPDVGEGDGGRQRAIPSGQCWRRTGANDYTGTLVPFDAERSSVLRTAAERHPPRPLDVRDLLGDTSDDFIEIERQLSDLQDQGPRREAASCGCSETSGGGGALDPTGGGTGPEPEQPDPGRLRIRVRVPPH